MADVKTIHVKYFAVFKEQCGQTRESIQSNAETVLEFYNEIVEKYKFDLPQNIVKVVVNDKFVDWSTHLKSNDQVVFIPPVAGG